jgi:hypothetical protein
MGISTGYGRVVTSGSVFAFDTADVINSYKGEPTTNLIPYAQYNSYPTYGNGWGTYNTNQYCGNNGCAVYWDIPAITSVSNNIITTVSAHPIRSFDVINPETTGGGLTATAQYVAKKISDTQFSLHAYNSSQDGSQGYINPATGGFKVHDSYWLDQRVSVNATSFPTKWWGYPHQPNSAIVKEIIPNGFTQVDGKKTDCIRLHWFRSDATDGMAYGVDAPLTIGTPVTVSFYARAADANAVGQYINFSNYNYGGIGGYNYFGMTVTWGAVGQWVRNSYTFTPTHAAIISYWLPSTGNMKVDIANIQVEHKTHATTFTVSSRSNTDAIAPLSGNAILDLTNVSFDANAQITFDGTNDYIDITNNLGTLSEYTIEHVSYKGSESRMPVAARINTNFYQYGDNSWAYTHGGVWGEYYYPKTKTINGWGHWVITYNGSYVKIYRNGIFEGQQATSGTADWTAGMRIGYWSAGGGYAWNGQIAVVKMYNRALTEGEVTQNYNKYKTKFKLS